ncbi:hydrogenase 4 subunit D [Thermococcus barophilus]|uniref:Membrane bound subgroup 4b [NiFe]-hydrogenase MBH(B)1, subunit Mbh(B)1H n=1 Tax=Thermococcus barophilus TaxID=55802 RepID=A0A0S1XA24_THEBA|nr:hydrogenase 4 subunit D [Thermococcus barophilus]ALM74617.1 Membrane bound subgroup 4b [NiFe]-hydrogenase MBH(b)1, subunit Mbh(b)1H [Thermococcus barophilus]
MMLPLISIVLAYIGLICFALDDKKADLLMLPIVWSIALIHAIAVLTFSKPLHIALLTVQRLGEVYGFIIDETSVFVAFVVATAGAIFLTYAVRYMDEKNIGHPHRNQKGRFYGWMMLFLGSTLAFIYSSTVLQMLIFFELMSLACWGVVGFYGKEKSARAALKALVIPNFGAIIGFYTAVAFGIKYGTFSLDFLGMLTEREKAVLFLCLMVAAFTKSAQFPLYSWIPDAMVAPTPASAFLHGAAMVEMGVYLLIRVVQFMKPPAGVFYPMAVVLILTLILAMLNYPKQRDAKRLLAYSTIAECSIMYTGVALAVLGNPLGIKMALFQLMAHAYLKGLAFLTAGSFTYYFGTLDMTKIRGLRNTPVLAYSWSIALLGLAGLPPFGIFFSKLFLFVKACIAYSAPLALALLVTVFLDSVFLLTAGIKSINEMVFSDGEAKKVDGIVTFSLVSLIALSVASGFMAMKLLGVSL